MKKCSKCNIEKSEENFNSKNNGLQPYCRQCQKASAKEHYRKNKESYYERNAKQSARLKMWLQEFKANKPCVDCKNIFHPHCMDFDHTSGDKLTEVSKLTNSGSLQSLQREIAKCELVCSNCHRLRTLKRLEDRLTARPGPLKP